MTDEGLHRSARRSYGHLEWLAYLSGLSEGVLS
jgi:hypothetical protein